MSRRPLIALPVTIAVGGLAFAGQALGARPGVPEGGRSASGEAARAAAPLGAGTLASAAQVRGGRVVAAATADRPDADPGDGRCADERGRCTLRAAVMEANANSDLTRIELRRRTYALGAEGAGSADARTGDLDVTRSLTVVGGGIHVAKTLEAELPPGLYGDPAATPRCTMEEFGAGACPWSGLPAARPSGRRTRGSASSAQPAGALNASAAFGQEFTASLGPGSESPCLAAVVR